MNKGDLIDPELLFIDLNDRSSDNSISEKVKELKNIGQTKVQLEVKYLPGYEKQYLQIDVDLFTKVKAIQDLPDWVIVKLILAEGKLGNTDFNDRILND